MNKTLPISNYKEEIVKAVANHAVTIITAETGSGKSTQVPQFLNEAGYDVVVTEPRRMAAWSLAERVAEEMGSVVGETVGFRTGFERKDSTDTSILFCTDGLELVRVLTDTTNKPQVLVIDEVHEWNINIEALIAWCKKKINEGWCTKVVVMSATLEKENLAQYFGKDVQVLEVPGKIFPVQFYQKDESQLISSIKEMIIEKRNTLVFVPGKKEILDVIEKISALDIETVVLPLHGELDSQEQKKCFKSYSVPKVIVATNVAQTSITIPDIDAVVDTGVERRMEVYDGIQGLFLRHISKADCMQRKGRAGRTKEGKYILCSNINFEQRPEFAVPEIQRGILDQIVLRLANCGIDATELEFFHQPSETSLLRSKETLISLGAITEENEVTTIGHKMAKIPVSVHSARMIIEAEKYGVTEEVICIASIMEIGGLLDRRIPYLHYTQEESSDLLAELDVWKKINTFKFIDFKEMGVNKKAYFRIKEHIKKLHNVVEEFITITSSMDKISIKKACLSGMIDNVYKNQYGDYVDTNGNVNKLDKHSCLNGWNAPKLLVGIPRTIEFKDSWGIKRTMDLVGMATEVTVEELLEVAPQFITQQSLEPRYSYYSDTVIVTKNTYFKDLLICENEEEVPNHPDYAKLKEEYESRYNVTTQQLNPRRQETVTIDGKELIMVYK